MLTASLRRKVLFLLLVITLATPWAASAEEISPFFARVWSFVTKIGCHLDPNGRCMPEAKEGCHIDPWGRCMPEPKAGCKLDPWGRCTPEAKEGCHLDPWGRCLS